MTTETTLTKADVTKSPKMRPARTEDGVTTGIWVTLAESVALVNGVPRRLPAGTLLSAPTSAGNDGSLGCMVQRRALVEEHVTAVYRF